MSGMSERSPAPVTSNERSIELRAFADILRDTGRYGVDFADVERASLLSDAAEELDRQRAEIERLQSRLGKIYWATTTNPDGLGLGDIQNICRPFSETHDPYADQTRALVAEIATRRGITVGHLRVDGGCELAQIMRRLDAADAEVERLRSAPHCPTCGCWR